jgi:hypothetical protein
MRWYIEVLSYLHDYDSTEVAMTPEDNSYHYQYAALSSRGLSEFETATIPIVRRASMVDAPLVANPQ